MIKAMILCAGFGKRLNPLTLKLPKPLLKIGKETLLSNTIKFLENYGIQEVIINVHYLGSQIIEYTKNNKFNLNITIIEEKEKILDTGGGVLNAIDYFSKEHFLIINPDTIWNATYYKYLRLMQKNIVSMNLVYYSYMPESMDIHESDSNSIDSTIETLSLISSCL